MTAADFALGFRSLLLMGLMMCGVMAPMNAWKYFRHHQEPKGRRLSLLGASATTLYCTSAFYGTYIRIDKEFSWGLPGMALGVLGFAAYLFLCGDEPEFRELRSEENRILERLIQ